MARVILTESYKAISDKVNAALSKEINKSLAKMANKIQNQIQPLIRSALLSSPEIASLRGGVLRAEFGLDNDPTITVVEAIVGSVQVTATKLTKDFKGGIQVTMQPTSYANLLSLPDAQQPLENGGSLPWLSWLLTLGDAIIIADFGVEFGTFPQSRTGEARMTKARSPYKVNSAFSGTVDNNFITRAVQEVSPRIRKIIQGAF